MKSLRLVHWSRLLGFRNHLVGAAAAPNRSDLLSDCNRRPRCPYCSPDLVLISSLLCWLPDVALLSKDAAPLPFLPLPAVDSD